MFSRNRSFYVHQMGKSHFQQYHFLTYFYTRFYSQGCKGFCWSTAGFRILPKFEERINELCEQVDPHRGFANAAKRFPPKNESFLTGIPEGRIMSQTLGMGLCQNPGAPTGGPSGSPPRPPLTGGRMMDLVCRQANAACGPKAHSDTVPVYEIYRKQ